MNERDTWQLLLDDFKKAREAPGSETLYALTDAWAAYIEQRDAEVERLRDEWLSPADQAEWAAENAALKAEIERLRGEYGKLLAERDYLHKGRQEARAEVERLQKALGNMVTIVNAKQGRIDKLLASPRRCDDCPGGDDYKIEVERLRALVQVKQDSEARLARQRRRARNRAAAGRLDGCAPSYREYVKGVEEAMSDRTKYLDERARRRELERNVAELKAMLKEKDARITELVPLLQRVAELEEEIKNLNWQLDQEFKV